MPRELSQLLLDEGVVGPDDVERALARQRQAGGALDTALLELGLVDEPRLIGLLARASDLPAAPLSVYEAVDARARRVFPSKVAERHGLAPFALDGRELSLVATCPLDLGLLDEISFMLSLHLTPHVGPEWRVRGLIQRLYGGTLAPRLARLAEVTGGPAAPPAAPADQAPPEAEQEPVPTPGPTTPVSRPAPSRPAGFTGFSRAGDEPLEPLAAALALAAEAFELDWEAEALAAPLPAPPGPAGPPSFAAEAPSRPFATPPPGAPAAAPLPPARPLDRSAPPRWSVAAARQALDGAVSRDEVVLAALRYARDFFQYAALFAVTRDAVAGHDALGAEDGTRDVVRTVALYVSDQGIFRTSLDTLAPYLGPVGREAAGTAAVLDGLGRGTPRTALVFPILLRGRPICILYADNGQAPVSARRLGDLLLVLSQVGSAFERIIKARKGWAPVAGPPAPAAPMAEMPVETADRAEVPIAVAEEPLAAAAVEPAAVLPEPAAAPPEPDAAPPVLVAAPPAAPVAEPAPPPAEPAAPAAATRAPGALDVEELPAEAPAARAPAPLDAPLQEAPPQPATDGALDDEPREVTEAFAEPPPLPPEPAQDASAVPAEAEPTGPGAPAAPPPLDLPPPLPPPLLELEEAFFSSPPGMAPVVAGPAAPAPPLPAEVSISLELTLEKPLAKAAAPPPPPEVTAPQAPPAPAPAPAPPPGPATTELPPEIAAAFPELPGVPGVEPPPPLPPPPPAPTTADITLEKPLKAPTPVAPVDAAALVGTYLMSPRGGDDRAFLLAKLVERAAEVAPILCDQLPGPLDVPPEALADTAAPDQGPVLAAVAALGPAALKPLLALLADPAAPRRRAAVALLGQLGEPGAFLPLGERCFDHDPAVAEAARHALALHRRDPGMKPVPEKLRRALLSGLADKAAPAARAIAALRDAESIPLLIQALEGSDAATAAASAEALATITLQRHGVKARDWLVWWKQNRGRDRTEWLFGALTSGDRDLRLLAANELRTLAASPVSYSADLPEAERLAAAQAWLRWYQKGGLRA